MLSGCLVPSVLFFSLWLILRLEQVYSARLLMTMERVEAVFCTAGVSSSSRLSGALQNSLWGKEDTRRDWLPTCFSEVSRAEKTERHSAAVLQFGPIECPLSGGSGELKLASKNWNACHCVRHVRHLTRGIPGTPRRSTEFGTVKTCAGLCVCRSFISAGTRAEGKIASLANDDRAVAGCSWAHVPNHPK